MANSSSSARPCASEANERSRREVGGVAAAPPSSSTTSCVSSFEKTVYLHDWWLIKVEDECSRARLGVGGLHSTGKTVRIFKSAPIVKRCYGDTLETADGITVMINGLINASRMHQNGFPSEACNHFQIGFPYYWKDYVDTYFQADTKGNGDSSSSAHPCASEVNERSRRVLGGVAATPPSSSTTSCVSSFEKTVFLHDWWLIKVEDECSPARLGVGGLHTTGKAAHIFKSAPIVKTYGVYTLETADGITVRIHGRINASRMHQNGFPSEACNHFQIGFPYCWKDYADKYFQTDTKGNGVPTCASGIHDCSMDSANTASRCSPVYSKESSAGRIVEWLNSICNEIVDGAQRCTDTAQNLCKNNDCKENTNVVTQADGNTVESDGNINVAEENAYMAANNDAQYGLKQVSNHVSSDSFSCGNMNTDSLLEEVLAECSYNEANDLQPESSKKMPIHTFHSMNSSSKIDINPEENSTVLPHVGMTVSEFPNKQFFLRRSERLSKLKIPGEDAERYLEQKKGSLQKTNSKSMADSATKAHSSMFVKDVNDCLEKWEMRLIDLNTMGLVSEKVLAECSYNEANDLHPESSKKMPIHTFHSMNSPSKIDINPEENSTDVPHVAMTVSEFPNKQFFLRRSERLSKLKIPAEDAERSLERNKGSLQKTNSKSMADGTHNRQSSASNINKGTSVTQGSHVKSADIHAVVARKLNFSLHESLHKYSITSNEDKAGKTPQARQRTQEPSFTSPELLNYKRSRSGRLLVPPLAKWCQKVLYDGDGSVAGILTGVDALKCDRRDKGMCAPVDGVEVLPPRCQRPRGRPKKKRIRGDDEKGALKRRNKCTRCHQWGHHKNTCKEPLPASQSSDSIVAGRPSTRFGGPSTQTGRPSTRTGGPSTRKMGPRRPPKLVSKRVAPRGKGQV